MPVVAVFQSPSLTQERYEESVRRLTDGKWFLHGEFA